MGNFFDKSTETTLHEICEEVFLRFSCNSKPNQSVSLIYELALLAGIRKSEENLLKTSRKVSPVTKVAHIFLWRHDNRKQSTSAREHWCGVSCDIPYLDDSTTNKSLANQWIILYVADLDLWLSNSFYFSLVIQQMTILTICQSDYMYLKQTYMHIKQYRSWFVLNGITKHEGQGIYSAEASVVSRITIMLVPNEKRSGLIVPVAHRSSTYMWM